MRPSKRQAVNKGHSARQFRSNSHRVKAVNLAPPPMRGGYRF